MKRGDWEVFRREQSDTDQLAALGFFVSDSSVTASLAADSAPLLKSNYCSIWKMHTAALGCVSLGEARIHN